MKTVRFGIGALMLTALATPGFSQYRVTFLDAGLGGQLMASQSGQFGGMEILAIGQHATIWNPALGTRVDLHPSAYNASLVYGISGTQQVGYATLGSNAKAMLWTGSSASAVNLAPAGTTVSYAFATNGTQQVGAARSASTQLRAMLWSGTASSGIILQPVGYVTSMAEDIDGIYQVGYVAGSGHIYAALWQGSAASTQLIHPAAAYFSRAHGMHGTQVVGEAGEFLITGTHAVLWTSFAPDSAVNLKPTWLDGSDYAFDTNGTQQVGYGIDAAGTHHAIVWSGTAASAFDLNTLLPAGATGAEAYSIDENGNIAGIAFYGALSRATVWEVEKVITGNVILKDYVGDITTLPLTVELRNPGSTIPLETHVINALGDGGYSFTTSRVGVFDLTMKGTHWLRGKFSNLDTSAANPVANFNLTNGDIDGDNEVAISDYSLLSVAYNSFFGDPNWNANADLNGDDAVDIADYAILSQSYGQFGDD